MRYLSVTNLDRFQHYKDRRPPWIKLYQDLLEDYAFTRLPDASKWQLVAIWLLASRYQNRIPDDAEWIGQQIHATGPVDLAALLSAGFLTLSQSDSDRLAGRSAALAPCPESAKPEAEAETELETDPPPPARAREDRPDDDHERHQIAHLEFALANRLASDADRNALTALIARLPDGMEPVRWLSEMGASLDGMAGHVAVSPEQLGQAIRDYVGNGAMKHPSLRHFRIYLGKAAQPVPVHAPTDDFDTAVTKHAGRVDRRALEAEAGEMLATIRGLVRSHDLHGQGRKDYLPKSEVEKLGPRVLRAYESVGGADRVLSASGDDIGYLIRDFTNAYVHASTTTPALVGGAA